jgi:hypothetical protein
MQNVCCPTCNVQFGLSNELYSQRQEDGETFYCPFGHKIVFRPSANERLRQEVADLKAQVRELQRQNNYAVEYARRLEVRIEYWQGQASGYKGQWKRVRNQLAQQA